MTFRTTTIAEIANPAPRSIAIGPFGSSLKADMYTSTGVPLVRGQNLTSASEIDLSDVVYVAPETASKFPACMLEEGDLVFPHRGAIGRVGIVGETPALLSSSMMKLKCDRSKADPRFVFYYFRGPGRRELMMRASTVGTPGIGQPLTSLREIPIQLPSIEEQRNIAGVLGSIDEKIAANIRLSAISEQLLATEVQQRWLTQPSGSAVSILTIFEVGRSLPAPIGAEPVYLGMKNIPESGVGITNWEHRSARGGARFTNGDTLLARITPCLENGKTGYVDFLKSGEIGIGSTEFIVLRSREGIPSALSYFLAIDSKFRDFAIRHMVGTSGRQRVSASSISTYMLPSPDKGWMNDFGARAAQQFALMKSLRGENRVLAALRDALLPELMSGRLRVKDAEKQIEEVL
ncbi:restriction endonuclease subunit S [Salinibacterium sp. UTAS2018]|uniref:restriction endonuclease subunit S n=1 Tax=Salinibacterium sp. UTAS2018 TaxID=2508880 RepID=UPI001009590B|nr:restriction endonuclease subunit S [Salinibacterium sp. UTAS2018]QAV70838.1 restriction endonuclease subunit S [Salinibacterium sp. UTAS2018]